MLEGQDWLLAGSELQHHGGIRQRFGFFFAWGLWIWGKPATTDKQEEDDSCAQLKKLCARSISASDRHFWSSSLFLSGSHSSSSVRSEFRRMFSWVWWAGKAPGRCKSGAICWQRGRQWRMEDAADAKWDLGSAWGLSVYEEPGSLPFYLQAMSKVLKAKNVSWVSTVLIGWLLGKGVKWGWLLLDYKSCF